MSAPPADQQWRTHLQHIVQGQVSEGFATEDQRLRGLLGLVDLVPGRLGVLHLGQLHVLSHAVKLLLCVFELADISEQRQEEEQQRTVIVCFSSGSNFTQCSGMTENSQ